jgi:3-oxoacyl-[acyl-carrier-protein] synthase II
VDPVGITGVGVTSPIGNTVAEFQRRLFTGVSGVTHLSRFDPGRFRSRLAAEVNLNESDCATGAYAHEIKRVDRFAHLALYAARMAISNSGLKRNGELPQGGGLFLGLGMGGLPHMEGGVLQQETRGPRKVSPYLIPSLIPSMAAGIVSMDLGMAGVQYTFASACSSGTQALGEAMVAIRGGRLDWALAGGTEAVITPITFSGFEAMRALSTAAEPATVPRPMDRHRDGMIVGEGAAFFVLESMERAITRGAAPIAALTGYASVSGGDGMVMRSATSSERCMRLALDDAGLMADRVDGIFTQAMGLPNDDRELEAIQRVFSGSEAPPVLTSIEGHIGHTFGASGPLSMVAAMGALEQQEIPLTLNFKSPSPGNEDLDIAAQTRSTRLENCLVNTYGFGGLNATLICHAATDRPPIGKEIAS